TVVRPRIDARQMQPKDKSRIGWIELQCTGISLCRLPKLFLQEEHGGIGLNDVVRRSGRSLLCGFEISQGCGLVSRHRIHPSPPLIASESVWGPGDNFVEIGH